MNEENPVVEQPDPAAQMAGPVEPGTPPVEAPVEEAPVAEEAPVEDVPEQDLAQRVDGLVRGVVENMNILIGELRGVVAERDALQVKLDGINAALQAPTEQPAPEQPVEG